MFRPTIPTSCLQPSCCSPYFPVSNDTPLLACHTRLGVKGFSMQHTLSVSRRGLPRLRCSGYTREVCICLPSTMRGLDLQLAGCVSHLSSIVHSWSKPYRPTSHKSWHLHQQSGDNFLLTMHRYASAGWVMKQSLLHGVLSYQRPCGPHARRLSAPWHLTTTFQVGKCGSRGPRSRAVPACGLHDAMPPTRARQNLLRHAGQRPCLKWDSIPT